MIFPLVAFISNGTFENVDGGPGLIFETLPAVFGSFGVICIPSNTSSSSPWSLSAASSIGGGDSDCWLNISFAGITFGISY